MKLENPNDPSKQLSEFDTSEQEQEYVRYVRSRRLQARLFGIFESVIMGAGFIYIPSSVQFQVAESLFGKTFVAGAVLFGSFIITDGFVDTLKGTHHYVGLIAWRTFTRSEERKQDINETIARWTAY